jgi:uncharacterized protein
VHSDLQHLITLQDLDSAAERLRRQIADVPALSAALDERLAALTSAVAAVKERTSASQAARREIEKDLAVVQGRLSKYKDQLMEVKTNKEYLAVQHEIAGAQDAVRGFEDRILELLVEADDRTAAVAATERLLADEEKTIANERVALDRDRTRIEREIAELAARRSSLTSQIVPDLVRLYSSVASTRRTAVVEVRDGHCTACHVRLRPQLYIELRRSERVFQCESCSRILFVPPPPAAPTPAP